MNRRKIINGLLRSLINNEYGSYEAAAAQINAENGTNLCKATISKRLSGQLPWPIEDVEALEDGVSVYPVTKRMAARLSNQETAAEDVQRAVASFAKEAGEAMQAALDAKTPEGRGKALKEAREAEDRIRVLIDSLEAENRAIIPLKGVVT